VNGDPVALVGVPLITFGVGLIVKPPGSPVMLQAYGVIPPVAATVVAVYGTPTCPLGSDVVVNDTIGATVSERFAGVELEAESVTVTVKL
jgi:hypothetical protein